MLWKSIYPEIAGVTNGMVIYGTCGVVSVCLIRIFPCLGLYLATCTATGLQPYFSTSFWFLQMISPKEPIEWCIIEIIRLEQGSQSFLCSALLGNVWSMFAPSKKLSTERFYIHTVVTYFPSVAPEMLSRTPWVGNPWMRDRKVVLHANSMMLQSEIRELCKKKWLETLGLNQHNLKDSLLVLNCTVLHVCYLFVLHRK